MISVEEAVELARQHFPEGPEKLAEHLRVDVEYSPLSGCDGWCVSSGGRAVIRVNSRLAKRRQRFTLAHELAHLFLSVPSVIGDTFADILRSNDGEERRVNDLAAELLIPHEVVRKAVPGLPIDAPLVKRLAERANVSDLAAALRIASLAEDLGLENASVVFFEGDAVGWQWSRKLKMSDETAISLRDAARESAPNAFRRYRQSQRDVVVASLIENPYFGSATLFVQLLPGEYRERKSHDERRAELEASLFRDQDKFRMQLQGCFGALKPHVQGMRLAEAEAAFWERYDGRFPGIPGKRLQSEKGREYVRLRLGEWCPT